MSWMRCLARALRDCQATPPSLSSATPWPSRAEARQHLDILDRQEQLVAAVIDQPQAVMRRAVDLQRLEPVVAADAVVLVHHQVALLDAGGVGDELVGPLAAARRPGDALAQQVLLADDREPKRAPVALAGARKPRSSPSTPARRRPSAGCDAGEVVDRLGARPGSPAAGWPAARASRASRRRPPAAAPARTIAWACSA